MKIHYQCVPFEALTLDQLYAIMALRQEVFIVEQHCAYLDADGRDQQAYHLMGYDENGRLATYVRILPTGGSYKDHLAIGRVITAPFARGKGLGKSLMQEAIREAYTHFGDTNSIKLSAQAHLQAYYGSVGFESIGSAYLEDGIPHVAMVKKGGDSLD